MTCAAAGAVGALAAGCGGGAHGASPTTASPTTPAQTAPPTTRKPSPPTTAWVAAAPQPSADGAAEALVNAWSSEDRATAGTVAAPSAVAALFALPYPGEGLAIPRGCTVAFPPIVCTYGPPGGASPSDPIFELSVTQTAKGWYVSSVTILS